MPDSNLKIRGIARQAAIEGDTLTVATDDDRSISVDLTHVRQDEYQRLGSNDRVVVIGIVPTENRVVATSIEPLEP